MKHLLKAVFLSILLGLCSFAQSTPVPSDAAQTQQNLPEQPSSTQPATQASNSAQPSATPGPASNSAKIAPGSVIPVQLSKTIDAKKAKTGDQVVATVTQDMKTQNGDVLVPKATKIIGHVTEAQARSKEQKESQLGITFDQAVLKDQPVQLPMSIQAVIGMQNNNLSSGGGAEPSPSSTGTTATSPMGGRSPMSGQSQPQPQPMAGASNDNGAAQPMGKMPPINRQTQGVIGISNVTLASGSSAQGSVLTSEKNNVKLEEGTMLLLKVNP